MARHRVKKGGHKRGRKVHTIGGFKSMEHKKEHKRSRRKRG